MEKETIYNSLQEIRESDIMYADRIANYMEANIDEFIESYAEVDD